MPSMNMSMSVNPAETPLGGASQRANSSVSASATSLTGPAAAPTSLGRRASSVYDKQLAWKRHGQRKLASRSQELQAREEIECTFTPKTNRPASPSGASCDALSVHDFTDEDALGVVPSDAEAEALLHPTEAQESSIQLHLVRQERARELGVEAQQRLQSTSTKDFRQPTAFAPFALSVSNWKPRTGVEPSAPTPARVRPAKSPKKAREPSVVRSSASSPGVDPETWESERATLLGVIEQQRRELELREHTQQEAVRVAERFADATVAFEERLVAVEQGAARELGEVRRLLTAQAAATDLILQSLGLRRPPPS